MPKAILAPWSLSSVGSTNKEDNALPAFAENDQRHAEPCWRMRNRGWSSVHQGERDGRPIMCFR